MTSLAFARRVIVGLLVVVLAYPVMAPQVFGADGVISQVYSGTGNLDSSVGLSASKTYVSAVNTGTTTNVIINGVTFTGAGASGNPSGTAYTTGSQGNVLSSSQTTVTGSLGTLLNTFIYGSGTIAEMVTLRNLSAGQTYTLTFYNRQWDTTTTGTRGQTATTTSGASLFFYESLASQPQHSLNLLRYTFTATSGSETITFTPQTSGYVFLNAGFSTEQVFNNTWVSGTNWTTASWGAPGVPSGVGTNADLATQSSPTTLSLDAAQTVGNLRFSGTNAWTLSGTNVLTLAADTGASAVLAATAGRHEIAAPTSWSSNIFKTGSGTLVLSGSITDNSRAIVLGAGALEIAVSSSQTLGGAISDGGNLVKSGAGTLTLAAANTYTGTTSVNEGTLRVGNGSSVGSLSTSSVITGSAGATLAFNRTDTVTQGTHFNSVIGGAINVSQAASGTLVLAGANTYTGTTSVNAGVLRIGNGGTSGSISGSSTITGSAGATLAFNRTDDYGGAFANTIGGGINVAVSSGTLALTGASTYTGETQFLGGVLEVSTLTDYGVAGPLGARASASDVSSIGLLFRGGTLRFTGTTPQSTNRAIRLNNSGGTIDASGLVPDAVLSFTANSSPNLFENPGARTLTLTGSNTGDNTFAMLIKDVSGAASDKTSFIKSGPGKWVLTGANTYTGATTISEGTLQIGAGGTLGAIGGGAITNNGTLVFNRSDAVSVGSTISGSGTLVNLGSGTLTLAAASTYTGATSVNAGILRIGNGGVVGSISGSSAITGSAGTTLAFNRTDDYGGTFANTIRGGISLMLSSGTLAVTGVNSYTGMTTIGSGALNVASLSNYGVDGSLGNRSKALDDTGGENIGLLFSGGRLQYTGSTAQSTNRSIRMDNGGAILDASGSVPEATMSFTADASSNLFRNPGARTLTLTGSNTGDNTFAVQIKDVSGAASDKTSLIKSGPGKWVLTGTNTYTGTTTISAGTLQVGAGGTRGQIAAGSAINNNGTLAFNRSDALTVSNAISGSGSVSHVGAGKLTLSGSNSYSGVTTVSVGTLEAASNALANTSSIAVNGGYLSAVNYNPSASLSLNSTGSAAISGTGLSLGAVTNANPAANALDFSSTSGTITLTSLSGAGNTRFRGGASIGGAVSQGSVTIDGVGTLGTVSGGTLALNGATASITTLTGGQINLSNNVTLSVQSGTFGGAIAGIGSLRKTGADTLLLSGPNSYSGGTWVDGGTVSATSGNAFGTGAITLGGGGTLDLANLVVNNAMSGNGGTIRGGSIMGLFSGSATLSGGQTTFKAGIAAGARISVAATGTATFGDGATVNATATVVNDGMVRINRSTNTAWQLAAPITGTGGLRVDGGYVQLSGANTYSGLTQVSGSGALLAVNGSVAGKVQVDANAAFGGSGLIVGNIGGSGLIGPGNSPGILTVQGQVEPTAMTSFAFEFMQKDPIWSAATASKNDVLQLTNMAPFASSLQESNIVNIYFEVASLAKDDTFRGGFFSNYASETLNFASAIGSPTYAYYVLGDGSGTHYYNNTKYYTWSEYLVAHPSSGITGVTASVVTVELANFSSGTVTNGQVTQFVIIPEPDTIIFAGIGIAAAAWGLARRRR